MHAHLQVLALRAKKTHIRGAEEEFQVCWQASARIIIKRLANANWDTATCARLPPAGRPLLIMGDMKVES